MEKYLFYIPYNNFSQPFYENWSFWLSVISLVFLCLTITETILLRREAQKQNKLNKQPCLALRSSINADGISYIIFNESSNIAFNTFLLLRAGTRFKILKDGYIIGAMPINKERIIIHDDFIDIDKNNLLKKIPNIEKLIKYLETKNEDYQCIIYEDIFGNKLYSLFFVGSITLGYDIFFKAGYISDI
jgi:hypothetical protein